MVYSTCSMNPVENEAVVAEVIKKLFTKKITDTTQGFLTCCVAHHLPPNSFLNVHLIFEDSSEMWRIC